MLFRNSPHRGFPSKELANIRNLYVRYSPRPVAEATCFYPLQEAGRKEGGFPMKSPKIKLKIKIKIFTKSTVSSK